MNLDGWKYLIEFGYGLYIYGRGRERVGINNKGTLVLSYKMGPDKSPRCKECKQGGKNERH